MLPIDSEQGKANSWHTDVTFVDRVPAISVMRAITLPPYGGTTVWANTAEAYRRLHPALKALVGELRATPTSTTTPLSARRSAVATSRKRTTATSSATWSSRPSTRSSASTRRRGSPTLLLGHFVRTFPGLGTADFNDLFGLLQRHITRLETTVRWTWRTGDIAVWDNRATQHYAVADYDDLHRITIAGGIPVGINGDTSIVRQGDASHYSDVAA